MLGEESRDQRGRLAGLGSVGVGREDVTKAGPLLVDDFDPGRCGLLRDPRRVVEQYLCSPDEHEQGRQPGQIRVQRRSQRLPLIAASKVMVGPSRAFVAVAEDRSFRKAAQRLLITQPALSRQIRGLERPAGCDLFRRSSAGLIWSWAEVAEVGGGADVLRAGSESRQPGRQVAQQRDAQQPADRLGRPGGGALRADRHDRSPGSRRELVTLVPAARDQRPQSRLAAALT